MKFDIFLSICQTEVDGYTPSERVMFENFFDQVKLADELSFGTAWVAETHLSCQVQKQNEGAVIPHFKGEIGLNTDIFQVAHKVFSLTKRINVGSAIRNIICNGGPIAHAEALKTFLTLHSMNSDEKRQMHLGFAAGRFPFSNVPYGFRPRNEFERVAWDVVKNKFFQEATEIFLRLLVEPSLSSAQVRKRSISVADFRNDETWEKVLAAYKATYREAWNTPALPLQNHWQFEKVGVIPADAPMDLLRLTIGSHDPETQIFANTLLPVGVFNLSITPAKVIEDTHERMRIHFNPKGGPWAREYMPRTVMIFLDHDRHKAKQQAERAWTNYWIAMEGTLDPKKVEQAVGNTIAGDPAEVTELIKAKYHKDDRLMLWFDFNNHDNASIKNSMKLFTEMVLPKL